MTKLKVCIWVRNDYSWTPPDKLVDFAAWAQSLLDEVPPEYREQAEMEVESEPDSYSVRLAVWYDRMETDEEEAAREAQDRARIAQREAAELATLHRLQAKYGERSK